jgi:hypothetical protein
MVLQGFDYGYIHSHSYDWSWSEAFIVIYMLRSWSKIITDNAN